MTSDQERAAPAQQPVAWRCDECGCASYARMDERKPEGGFGPSPLVRCVNCKKVHNVPASSEPELRAEIVRLTRERDEAIRWRREVEALSEEHLEDTGQAYCYVGIRDYAAMCESVEALSAEVGKLTEALEATKTASHNHFMQAISNGEAAFDAKAKLAEAPDPRHFQILAEAMAEVKAISDGESDQPIADIVAGCLAEIEALPARAALDKGATA